MSFGNWLNKEVKRIQDSYKEEEEQRLEAEAEELAGDDYDRVLDTIHNNGYWAKTIDMDDDYDAVHPDVSQPNVNNTKPKRKSINKIRADRLKNKIKNTNSDDWEVI